MPERCWLWLTVPSLHLAVTAPGAAVDVFATEPVVAEDFVAFAVFDLAVVVVDVVAEALGKRGAESGGGAGRARDQAEPAGKRNHRARPPFAEMKGAPSEERP